MVKRKSEGGTSWVQSQMGKAEKTETRVMGEVEDQGPAPMIKHPNQLLWAVETVLKTIVAEALSCLFLAFVIIWKLNLL